VLAVKAELLDAAELWTDTLGRKVRYAGNDLDAFEKNVKARTPAWMAYEMRAMMRRYRDFAAETAQVWQA
jgi:hypothetical protein